MSEQAVKWIEIRRHSIRDGAGDLNAEGKALAERVAKTLPGSYAVVVTSGKPRAVQTAVLFGQATPETDDRLSLLTMPEGVIKREVEALMEKKGLTALEAYFSIPTCRTVLRESGQKVVALVQELAEKLKSGERALCVSHGGTIEPAVLIALKQEFSLEVLGGEFAECEGATFAVVGSQIVGVDIHRLSALE